MAKAQWLGSSRMKMRSMKSGVIPPRAVLGDKGWRRREEGKIGWILLWLLGIPIPVLLGLFLLRGCT
jgi:hypothetical protein